MSTLAIEAGILLIDGIIISLAEYFPPDDGPQFSEARKNLIDALCVFEKTSERHNTAEAQQAHQKVEFRLNALLSLFDDESSNQKVYDVVFCCLYRQITKTIDDFEHLLEINGQKQYLLADLFEIPMDHIHGHLLEYNVSLDTHYTVSVLNMLLTRNVSGQYPEHTIESMKIAFNLSRENALRQLERLYSFFEITAARYNSTAHEHISQLLDKKKRNRIVHVGRELVDHYRKHQERGTGYQDLVSIEPKFQDFLNRPRFRSVGALFTDDAIVKLEKMFTDYCKSHIEKW